MAAMVAGKRMPHLTTLLVAGRVNLKYWYTFSRIAAHLSMEGSVWS